MKYWTIVFPGDHGQHVQETWSEDQIIESYYRHWSGLMLQNSKTEAQDISIEHCIEDWVIVHWAVETDKFGNKLGEKMSIENNSELTKYINRITKFRNYSGSVDWTFYGDGQGDFEQISGQIPSEELLRNYLKDLVTQAKYVEELLNKDLKSALLFR